MAGLLLLFCASATVAVPLPKPRPAEAPAAQPGAPDAAAAETAPHEAGATPDQPANAASPATGAATGKTAGDASEALSACRLALTDAVAQAPSVPPIRGPGGCGGDDLVRLEAVVLADGQRVVVKPAAILRCPMAREVADWVRTDVAQLAQRLGSVPSEIDNFDAFECRGRNRVVGAKLSEHGRANALDVRGVRLTSGRFIALTDRAEPRALREEVLHTVCARFSTVLGPGSDWYHEEHIHLDLAERRSGYRTCDWGVYDPLPTVAPQLPAERPEEAPPREAKADSAEEADQSADLPQPEVSRSARSGHRGPRTARSPM